MLNDGTMPKADFEKRYGKHSSVTSAQHVKPSEERKIAEPEKPEIMTVTDETPKLKKFEVLDNEGKAYGHQVEAVSLEEAAKLISPDETLMEISGETLNADGSVTAS